MYLHNSAYQLIVALDQFHLERVEVRSLQILDQPKDLLIPLTDIFVVDSRGCDIEGPHSIA
jgi:hypothetical protein